MTPQKAELYDLAGNKLPQTWVLYLPDKAIIGKSKAECVRQYEMLCRTTDLDQDIGFHVKRLSKVLDK